MLTAIHPKLPMRDKVATENYYQKALGFTTIGDYGDYLIMQRDHLQIHFFEFKTLDSATNYGQIYIRTQTIDALYQSLLANDTEIHPNGKLDVKPWGQKEFALLDPNHNLLTFGESL